MRRPVIAALGLVLSAEGGSAQSLPDRIAGVRNGTVRMSYAARTAVCGDGRFIGFDLPDAFWMYSSWNDGYSVNMLEDVRPNCRTGPMRLVIEKAGGAVVELRAAVGVAWRPSETAVDLGEVSAAAAADWLVGAAESGRDRVGRVALLAAAAADSARVTDRVIALARNRSLPADARARALRWVTVVALAEGRGADADRTLRAIADDESDTRGVRDRAIRDLRRTPDNVAHLRSLFARVGDVTLRERILREVGAAKGAGDAAWVRGVALDARESLALRERAIRVLGEELDRPDELRTFYPRLDRTALRERVLRVVAERGGADAVAWLRDVVEDGAEDVALRDRAIRLLAERRQGSYLREAYGRVDRTALKERIVRSVAESGEADAARWLAGLVLREGEPDAMRDRAVRSLAERGAPSSELAGLYDRVASTAVKQRLIRILADRRDDAAREKLAAIAEGDADPGLRRSAERAVLGR
jgi:hypothetical protein